MPVKPRLVLVALPTIGVRAGKGAALPLFLQLLHPFIPLLLEIESASILLILLQPECPRQLGKLPLLGLSHYVSISVFSLHFTLLQLVFQDRLCLLQPFVDFLLW